MSFAAPPVLPVIEWESPARHRAFDSWLNGLACRHGLRPASLRPASADASFRRYFRIDGNSNSYIVMDAPPPQEDVRPFIQMATRLADASLAAPRVLEADTDHGFLLLSDLGTRLLLSELQQPLSAAGSASGNETLMRSALTLLVTWQTRLATTGLPIFDEALLRHELALFPQWCVKHEFGVDWDNAQQSQWAAVCDALVANALAQPRIAVHRDYMPRNLMVMDHSDGLAPVLALLDFQDAVSGPIAYDVASLLRDAFISWEEAQELDWAVRYWQQAREAKLPVPQDFGDFWRQLEWTGLQRHLKVLGIFCRLKHRDGKPHYSADLPRFFTYAHKVACRYQGLGPLARLLEPLMGATRNDVFY